MKKSYSFHPLSILDVTPRTLRPVRRVHPRAQTRYGIILGLIMIVVAIVWNGLLRGKNLAEWFPTAHWQSDLLVGMAIGAAFGLVAWRLLDIIPALKYVEQIIMASLVMDEMGYEHALFFGLLAGIPEEILFRGAVQPALGVVIAAVIFGVFHAINLPYFLYATGAGIMLGLLARNGLWMPIAAHTMIDAVMFVLLIRRWRRMRTQSTIDTVASSEVKP